MRQHLSAPSQMEEDQRLSWMAKCNERTLNACRETMAQSFIITNGLTEKGIEIFKSGVRARRFAKRRVKLFAPRSGVLQATSKSYRLHASNNSSK